MQLMKEGAKWELYIPSELGYGDRGAGGLIPGGEFAWSGSLRGLFRKPKYPLVFFPLCEGAALVFTMELLEVMGESQ